MIALQCPACGANFHIEQMREFAFCSYCGTQIQLMQTVNVVHHGTVNVQGIPGTNEKIESARRLINIGEYVNAKQALENITRQFPDCGEAWLELALCDFKRDLFGDGRTSGVQLQGYRTTPTNIADPSQIKDAVFARLRNDHNYQVAEKLMGKRAVIGLCGSFIQQLNDEIDTALELSARQITRFAANPLALSCYVRAQNEYDYDYRCFFNYHGQLYYRDSLGFYRVDAIQGNCIHISLQTVLRAPYVDRSGRVPSPHPRHQTLHILYVSADEKYMRMAGGLLFDKHDAIGGKFYEDFLFNRRQKRQCPICGGEQTMFGGCKSNCSSWIR